MGTSSSEPNVQAAVPAVSVPTHEQKKASVPDEHIKVAETAAPDGLAAAKSRDKSADRAPDATGVWPAQIIEGALGRLVRIGRFTTPGEAEKGWATVLRQYPGMQRLPSVAVPIKSLRDGHTYYRLQVGTSSQAHSKVVCERVRDMDQSCAVIGSDEGTGESAI